MEQAAKNDSDDELYAIHFEKWGITGECPSELEAKIDAKFGITGRDSNGKPLNGYCDWKKDVFTNGPSIYSFVKLGMDYQKEQMMKGAVEALILPTNLEETEFCISDWETYDKIRNWAIGQSVPLKNGKKVPLVNFMYHPCITKSEWDEYEASCSYGKFEIVLWNTPTYIDVWLIRNCPFEEIQEHLKEQYGGGWSKTAFTNHNDDDLYEQIKNGTSAYDTFERNGRGKEGKIKIIRIFGRPIRDKRLRYWVQIRKNADGYNFWYNDDDGMWYDECELMPWNTNTAIICRSLTKKSIVNLVRKWDLPKGTVLYFDALVGRCGYYSFYVYIK